MSSCLYKRFVFQQAYNVGGLRNVYRWTQRRSYMRALNIWRENKAIMKMTSIWYNQCLNTLMLIHAVGLDDDLMVAAD